MSDPNVELRRKIMGFIVSQTIHAVVEAGVVDELAKGPAEVGELAAALGLDADALRRFVRVLTAEGLFVQDEPGTYALTETGALLRSDVKGSLRHFSRLMAETPSYQAWSQAQLSLRTGGPAFDEVFGKPMFEWLADHPADSESFNRAQAGLAELRLLPILEQPWAEVASVVDVGGGNGALIATLLQRQPHLKGTVFDQPHVVGEAHGTLAEAGVDGRAECVGGDFFAAVPSGADVYVMAQILHDWSDDEAAAILARCREAMPSHAHLLILEQVIRDDDLPDPAKLLDLHMLIMLGGRERSRADWTAILRRAGFVLDTVETGPRSSLLRARPQ